MIKKLLFSAMICAVCANAEVVNGVIAVVDNEPITGYELAKVQKLTGASPQAAMEILIGQKLQQSEIKRRGIAVNDAHSLYAQRTCRMIRSEVTLCMAYR